MSRTKKLVFCGVCVALAFALPLAFHGIANAGGIFLPMHIPVLLCGLVCGWPYGLACGAIAPLLSSLMTGMPPAAVLPGMVFELMTYGLVAGLMLKWVGAKNQTFNLYIALVAAMLCGRAVSGALNALIFRAGDYSLAVWLSASFVTALPGILIQLVAVPALVLLLRRARVIEPAA